MSGIINIHYEEEDPNLDSSDTTSEERRSKNHKCSAACAYLASAAACSVLVCHILPPQIQNSTPTLVRKRPK